MDLNEKLKKEKMEKEKIENEQIDKLFAKFQEEIAKMRKILQIYNDAKFENRKLDNIAIIINNKIIELSHKFTKKGILFYSESALESLILKEFKSSYDIAKANLEKAICIYIDLEENIDYMPDEIYFSNLTQALLYTDVYQNFANEIWKFDIRKDITKIIIDERKDYSDKKRYEHILEKYKQELKILGYEDVLRDLNAQINNSSDEEKEFFERLKFVQDKTNLDTPQAQISQKETNFNAIENPTPQILVDDEGEITK